MSVDQLLSSFYDSFLNLTASHPSSTGLNLTQYPLPPSLQSAISSYLNKTDISDIAESPRQVGGCNDAYSAFAFLSFLFALLTFIQNNQGRRKRSTSDKVTVYTGIQGVLKYIPILIKIPQLGAASLYYSGIDCLITINY